MNTTAFYSAWNGTSYANFKKNFLNIFWVKSQTDLTVLASKVDVRLTGEASSLHEMKALIPTRQLVTDHMDVIQLKNWLQGQKKISEDF